MAVVAVVGASVVVGVSVVVAAAAAAAVPAAVAVAVPVANNDDEPKGRTLNPEEAEEEETGTLQWQFWPSMTSSATV